VLLVEDEDMLRSAVARTLESAGHRVTSAGSAEEALALVESGAVDADVLVSDITLPGLAGPELADRLRARWPSLAVLFCTGYTEHVLADRGDPRIDMIEKPFTLSTLLERVEAVVGAAEDGEQPGGPDAADRPGGAR
jgi:two-component system, cell cycle sensor histidine kinase and response regulator CckA